MHWIVGLRAACAWNPHHLACCASTGTLDAIIDTVSAQHDVNALLALLAPRGKLVMVGLPPAQPTVNHFSMVMK
jgi:D-arabinose 1-dehydrogenase-like Zn-dependent alcohol dehydrogenase